MARLQPVVLVVVLIAATAAAFARTELLKLEPSPILRPHVDAIFSPTCACPDRTAAIDFTVRKGGPLSVAVVDGDGNTVRTLLSHRTQRARDAVALRWDGRDGNGAVVADGTYRPRLELGRRTILMPNRIVVDTVRPEVEFTASRPVISPDGDGRFDSLLLRYRTTEPARAVLFVGDRVYERKRALATTGSFRWTGRLGGRKLPAGTYRLSLVAVDAARNPSLRTTPQPVVIRFVVLGRDTLHARTATRFGVRVRTDARRVTWTLAGRRGSAAAPGVLVLRAPSRPGRYPLFVAANGHADRATLVVTRRPVRKAAQRRIR